MQDVAISSWDIAVAEGIEKGIKKGIEIEALKGNIREVLHFFALSPHVTSERIAEVIERPLSFVLKIKSTFSGKNKRKDLDETLEMFNKFPDMRREDIEEITAMVEKYAKRITL